MLPISRLYVFTKLKKVSFIKHYHNSYASEITLELASKVRSYVKHFLCASIFNVVGLLILQTYTYRGIFSFVKLKAAVSQKPAPRKINILAYSAVVWLDIA